MTGKNGGHGARTDKECLLELLAKFRVVPALYVHDLAGIPDAEHVELHAKEGGVRGYSGFFCQFTFRPDGSFYEVGVWE